eukprot:12403-Pelagomonas_calceolata.AAC.1
MGIYFHDAVGFLLEGCDQKGVSMKYCETELRSQSALGSISLYKIKSHTGIASNECADAVAKHQAI